MCPALRITVLSATLGVLASGATLTVDPSAQTISPGSAFTLNISISTVSDLYAFQFDFQFDPSLVTVTDVVVGNFFPIDGSALFVPGVLDPVAGTLAGTVTTLLGPVQGLSGEGILARLEVFGLTPGASSLEITNVILLDSTLFPIDSTVANATVRVTSIPEPSSVTLLPAAWIALIYLRRQCALKHGTANPDES
jgi:hypothetical protein